MKIRDAQIIDLSSILTLYQQPDMDSGEVLQQSETGEGPWFL